MVRSVTLSTPALMHRMLLVWDFPQPLLVAMNLEIFVVNPSTMISFTSFKKIKACPGMGKQLKVPWFHWFERMMVTALDTLPPSEKLFVPLPRISTLLVQSFPHKITVSPGATGLGS